jgi:hypothetical protein
MEIQNENTKEYPIFEGQLSEKNIENFRRDLRKAVTKTHCKVELNSP